MSQTTYCIETAKSGRSTCKTCKEKIAKDELRIGKESPGPSDGFAMTSWYHAKCFVIPPKALKGVTPEEFVDDMLRDNSESGDDILPARRDEVVALVAENPPKKKKSEDGGDSFIAKLKREYEVMTADGGGDDEEPKAKKAKSSDQRALELYGEYHKHTLPGLKEILDFNRQTKTGTKAVLLHKVIDGALNGRLGRCTVCGGRLKMNDDCTKVACLGNFDEEHQTRIPCAVTYKLEEAPRYQPWFTDDPTEEEKEEMDRLEAVAKGEDVAAAADAADVDPTSDLGKLLKEAEGVEIDVAGKAAIQATVAKIMEVLEANGNLDLPEDGLKMKIGKGLMANKEMTASQLIMHFAKEFGFKKAKAAKATKKKEAMKESCNVPANAPILMAFEEMADLYFKEGNSNGGATYKKVVKAIKDLDFEITKENAKSLGKAGKMKVQNIGKGSADKMFEFLDTGKIEKLETLRENNA